MFKAKSLYKLLDKCIKLLNNQRKKGIDRYTCFLAPCQTKGKKHTEIVTPQCKSEHIIHVHVKTITIS